MSPEIIKTNIERQENQDKKILTELNNLTKQEDANMVGIEAQEKKEKAIGDLSTLTRFAHLVEQKEKNPNASEADLRKNLFPSEKTTNTTA